MGKDSKRILQKNDPVLRQKAKSIVDFKTPLLTETIESMKTALAKEHDGVAIAAPQIGISERIFVVSHKVFDGSLTKEDTTPIVPTKDQVFINPTIIKKSQQKKWLPEGCLSVRHWYGETHRYARVTIRAYDEEGNEFTRGSSGLLAQIFQHEIDHLDGILFSDHARKLSEVLPEKDKTP